MDRRRFLTFLSAGMLGLGCQPAASRPNASAPIAREPTGVPTLAFPRARDVVPTPAAEPAPDGISARASEEQSRIIPLPRDRPTAYSTRTIPPERLIIPAIALDAKVVSLGTRIYGGNTVWETAAFAAGHHRGSANPGEPGNLVLSGHISSPNEGAVFKRLPEIKVGDGVIVATAQQHFVYVARDVQVVKPNAIEVLNPTSSAVATLITCVPDGVYSHRLVIRCDAV